ncbi:helix-turn-helix domain-containing protein [Isoptericola sp. NEAU-Y5]|uniref:Helix-turn-helix domain-containing protein n=1 Tax=Isoptericola luteus TaxID=2879484 RepID=A0ABS7ZIU4_9MICO|nr:helix-turn-helix domain-containing protein [Isoptericola sp. NEAU-Y5]MCA5894948.1 helix-turn-helix domain-containing protein [Isoptericola sp. NEAU-Y5]
MATTRSATATPAAAPGDSSRAPAAEPVPRGENVQRVREGLGMLTATAMRRLDEEVSWYRQLPAEDRSYVGLVAQSAINAFVNWFAEPAATTPHGVGEMFAAAPPELTRSISLQHTLQLVRLMVDVVESHSDEIAAPGYERDLREAVLRYSREVAFSAAEVYARAAEVRGAWDARLEALVVDALVRGDGDDSLRSRVSALGWSGRGHALVVVGEATARLDDMRTAELRRLARRAAGDALVGIHGDRLVLVLGGEGDLVAAATSLLDRFGPGPVVIGGVVPDVSAAALSAGAALAGLAAAAAWPHAPRPVLADDLLPERVLTGDLTARRTLVAQAYRPLEAASGSVLETLSAYLGTGRSLEAAARRLYVHPNTVRYRLRKVSEITGWDPLDARESFVLQVALALGQLDTAHTG